MSLFRKDEPEYCIGGRRSFVSRLWYKTKNLGRKLKDTAAVVSGKRFPKDKRFISEINVYQDVVELDPERYIIKECIPACKILWDKNIYTFMCSDYENESAWIEIDLDNLSEDNLSILEDIKEKHDTFSYHSGCINLAANGFGKKAMEELVTIANKFVMQDVPKKSATISLEKLLFDCGCYKRYKNPNYVPFEEQIMNSESYDWSKPFEEEFICEFDPSQITKPIDEYVADYGAVYGEDGLIYRNEFHYNKHLNYLRYLDKDNGDSGFKI